MAASATSDHLHISHLWYRGDDGRGAEQVCTRALMVEYVEKNGENSVWCPDRNPTLNGAWLYVNHNAVVKWVQTMADGRWTDNLLALPLR